MHEVGGVGFFVLLELRKLDGYIYQLPQFYFKVSTGSLPNLFPLEIVQ